MDDNRKLVHEIKLGNSVIKIYRKDNPKENKFYFDWRPFREFTMADDTLNNSPYMQQRDIWDCQKLLIDLQAWISDQHRRTRNKEPIDD
jgi:hypothetical protein